MNSKELTSIIAGAHFEEVKQKPAGKKSKHQSQLEEFQDIEFIKQNRPEPKPYSKQRGKRQKSSEKQKKNKSKGHSYDSLKPGSKVGASTPE